MTNMMTAARPAISCATSEAAWASVTQAEAAWKTALGEIERKALWATTEAPDAFSALMADTAGDRAAYLVLRDRLRAALRTAETLQRARRRLEVILKAGDPEDRREAIYGDRMRARRTITRLIALRRAGKAWAAAAVMAERAAA